MPQHSASWWDNHSESNDFTESNSERLNAVTKFFVSALGLHGFLAIFTSYIQFILSPEVSSQFISVTHQLR